MVSSCKAGGEGDQYLLAEKMWWTSAGLGDPASDLPRLWSGRLGEHAGRVLVGAASCRNPGSEGCQGCFPLTLNSIQGCCYPNDPDLFTAWPILPSSYSCQLQPHRPG